MDQTGRKCWENLLKGKLKKVGSSSGKKFLRKLCYYTKILSMIARNWDSWLMISSNF